MKIVYTLNSSIICNIMIIHSWVNGWSCITWYNVYVARVYRISKPTFVVLFTGKFLLHLYMRLERLFMSTYIVFYTLIILSSCKWYNTELTYYKYSTPCSLIIIVSFIHGLLKRDVNVSYSQLQNYWYMCFFSLFAFKDSVFFIYLCMYIRWNNNVNFCTLTMHFTWNNMQQNHEYYLL